MAIENQFKIAGTLYSKPIRHWENKIKGTSGDFYYYVLEVSSMKRWSETKNDIIKENNVTKRDLLKFMLAKGYDQDTFEVKDNLIVDFTIEGREYDKKDGTGKDFGLELRPIKIGFAPLEDGEIRQPRKVQDPVFTTPLQREAKDDNNDDNLPF